MAIGKYILMPWPYLATPWFQRLSGRQMAVFLAMLGLSRMDKRTPDGQLKVSLRVLGKELNMSTTTVKRTVDELLELGVVAIVVKADGRSPAVYELAEPLVIRCTGSVPGTGVNAERNGDLRSSFTPKAGTQGAEGGGSERKTVACVPHSRENAEHYIHTPRGGVLKNSPSLGTGEPFCVPGQTRPACKRCGGPLRKTGVLLTGTDYRVWRCDECCWEIHLSDADGTQPGQPAYSKPKPPGRQRLGGQDAATAKFD